MDDNKDELMKDMKELMNKIANDELELHIPATPLWNEMVKEATHNPAIRKKQLMRLEKEHLVDMVFDLESRNETLVTNLLVVEKMYNDLKGEEE